MTEFSDFLAPLDAAVFHAQYYGIKPVHIVRNEHGGPNLLDWARFNEVLAITPYWNEDTLKLFFNNRAAPRENYCTVTDLHAGARAPVNSSKVNALMGLGASLVANKLHLVCPQVDAIARMLEHQFSTTVAANVYCSFKGVQAFETHFDLHDVFAVQTEGEKLWRVYEARAETPISPVPPGDEGEKWLIESRGRLLFEAHMKPGDVLYLPRGQYHDALTGSESSLHVSFGIAPATGLALFKLLENLLTRESAFRAYLPNGRQETELRERLAELAERIKAVVTSPAFLIDVMNHQRDQARPPTLYGLPTQTKTVWYSVARQAKVVRGDLGCAVVFEGGKITLGATYPTVERILQQRLFSMDEAAAWQPGVDPQELRDDIERLLSIGIIVKTEMHQ